MVGKYLTLQFHLTDWFLQGRRLGSAPIKLCIRSYASEVDAIQASLDNSLKETHSIESLLERETTDFVPHIDDKTHATFDLESDSVARRHHVIKHHRKIPSTFTWTTVTKSLFHRKYDRSTWK